MSRAADFPPEMTVDELGEYGLQYMDDDAVEGFLSSMNIGVLGIPTDGAPYLIPMSYGYPGGSDIFFYFVVGNASRKETLADAAESASFLVYNAETMFTWRSVLVEGTLRRLPDERRADLAEEQMPTWRPEIFEEASESGLTALYEFRIQEWTGLRQTGLPPAFRDPGDD